MSLHIAAPVVFLEDPLKYGVGTVRDVCNDGRLLIEWDDDQWTVQPFHKHQLQHWAEFMARQDGAVSDRDLAMLRAS